MALMSLPVLYLMAQLIEHQWIMPLAASRKGHPRATGGAGHSACGWPR
jgi:hypothetical protein